VDISISSRCGAEVGGEDARVGPDLTHMGSRPSVGAGQWPNNYANLAGWIANPQALKPGALMPNLGLTDDQIRYIVAYLQTLH
jgi:cytochrome c oxidase subunit 2